MAGFGVRGSGSKQRGKKRGKYKAALPKSDETFFLHQTAAGMTNPKIAHQIIADEVQKALKKEVVPEVLKYYRGIVKDWSARGPDRSRPTFDVNFRPGKKRYRGSIVSSIVMEVVVTGDENQLGRWNMMDTKGRNSGLTLDVRPQTQKEQYKFKTVEEEDPGFFDERTPFEISIGIERMTPPTKKRRVKYRYRKRMPLGSYEGSKSPMPGGSGPSRMNAVEQYVDRHGNDLNFTYGPIKHSIVEARFYTAWFQKNRMKGKNGLVARPARNAVRRGITRVKHVKAALSKIRVGKGGAQSGRKRGQYKKRK